MSLSLSWNLNLNLNLKKVILALFSTGLFLGLTLDSRTASAQAYPVIATQPAMQPDPDPGPPPPGSPLPPKKPSKTTITPELGIAHGQWMKLTVTRAVIGLDVRSRFGPTFGGSLLLLVEPGKTEAGLGAHRMEAGYALLAMPTEWLDVMVGVQVSYAMMVRATKDEGFGRALTGDIGGFGIGGNLRLAASVPVSENLRVVFGLRGAVDVFNRGLGLEAGPTVGLRF
jgi:hypothetical protein